MSNTRSVIWPALVAAALFGGSTAVGALGAQLVPPLFMPGLAAEKRAARAAFDAALANHQAVVLEAGEAARDTRQAEQVDQFLSGFHPF